MHAQIYKNESIKFSQLAMKENEEFLADFFVSKLMFYDPKL